MSMFQNAGGQLLTADGAVGVSGKPVRVYMIHVISGGGGGAVVALKNGTGTGDTTWISETGTTNKGVTFTYGSCGIAFPSGCFVDVDTNTTSVAVSFERMDA